MSKTRLESLDILRGLDMWFLLMAGPILQSFIECADSPSLCNLARQMGHCRWEGFVAWDIIMPLFLFMSGVTIPFSMAKYRSQKPDKIFFLKLLKRIVCLFVLGWIVQGNLLALDWKVFHPFANTLQAIAVGYLFAALSFVYLGTGGRIVFCILCFLGYILVFIFPGQMNFDINDNIAMTIDKAILGSHRDGVKWDSAVSWHYSQRYNYTWILSSLNFIVTVMLGAFAGSILKGSESGKRKAAILSGTGIALIAAGLALSPAFPIIKKIWSSSMTLYSGGVCYLLLALVFYVVDVKGWSRGMDWIKFYGMNSILAYCLGEAVSFSSISESLLFGFEQFLGDYYQLLITISNAFILFFILRAFYKAKIFIKV